MFILLFNLVSSDETICQTCLSVVNDGLSLARKLDSPNQLRVEMIANCKKMDLYFRTGCIKLVEDYFTEIFNGRSNPSFSQFNLCKKAKGCEDSDDPDRVTSDRYGRQL
jgi:hypothetical protein